MVTCSSDQKIKVWDLDDHQQWKCTGEWKSHHGSIWRVAWAAPEYGQVIASCSFDRTICIWEEPESMFVWFLDFSKIVLFLRWLCENRVAPIVALARSDEIASVIFSLS
jgi:WD40 repeat protein